MAFANFFAIGFVSPTITAWVGSLPFWIQLNPSEIGTDAENSATSLLGCLAIITVGFINAAIF